MYEYIYIHIRIYIQTEGGGGGDGRGDAGATCGGEEFGSLMSTSNRWAADFFDTAEYVHVRVGVRGCWGEGE